MEKALITRVIVVGIADEDALSFGPIIGYLTVVDELTTFVLDMSVGPDEGVHRLVITEGMG